jgi:hypothetical protein
VSPAFAVDYTDRITTTYGKKLWILTDTSNTPIQEISAITTAGLVDFDGTGLEYVAHLDDANTLTSSWAILLQGTLSHTVWRSQRNCKSILSANSLTQWIDGEYWINIGWESLKVYCDMTTDGGWWTLVIQGHDDDIIKYDIRWNDSWDTNNTISYWGLDNTFKFSDDILNHIRSGGMYMTHWNSDIATEARFYMDSTCNYNHTLGLNGTCWWPNTLYDDVALTSARTCVWNLSYKWIWCWWPVIMNYTWAGKDNAFCYTNWWGWCAANTTVENIVLRLYVR